MNHQERPGVALLSFAHGHQNIWGRILAADPRADVVCAWDDDPERGEAAAERLGVPFVPDLDAVLDRSDITAVTICSTTDQHADLAVAAARAGKDLMVQKPMATTLDDCDRIVEAVAATGVRYFQAHHLRFDPVHQEVKRLVDAGELGTVQTVRRRQSHALGLLRPELLGWMADRDAAGGGVLMDEGAHAALWFHWMFGPPKSVLGMVTSATGDLTEDTGVLLYRYADGMLGILQSSWTEMAGANTIELYGDKAVLVAAGTDLSTSRSRTEADPALRVWRPNLSGPPDEPGPRDPRDACGEWQVSDLRPPRLRPIGVVKAFVDMLTSDAPSPSDAEAARAAVEMVLAGYQAATEGREVTLPLLRAST